MGNGNQKNESVYYQNVNKNGGLSKKQPDTSKALVNYPNYMYPQQQQQQHEMPPQYSQMPYYYHSPQELMSQQQFYSYDPVAQSQYYQNSIPSAISSAYGSFYEKPYVESAPLPVQSQALPEEDTGSKYAVRGSKKQAARESKRVNENASPSPFYQNLSSFYQPFNGFSQNYMNYYPSNLYSYYSGLNNYCQPYSQIYMNFGQQPLYSSVPTPKIKVKDYVIPLPQNHHEQQVSSSENYRRKSKKIKSPTDFERHSPLK